MIAAVIILSALLVLSVLLNPVLLVVLLRPALLCVDGNSTKPAHVASALLALVVDVLGALTWWRLIAGPRQVGEKTISDTLERLCVSPGVRRQFFIEISKEINRQGPVLIPAKSHIKAVSS
jgi:hypothetical protein